MRFHAAQAIIKRVRRSDSESRDELRLSLWGL